MTKHEARRTEGRPRGRPPFPLRASSLGLRHSFVIRHSSFVILCALALLGCGGRCRADDPPSGDDIPLVGRPANLPFSGASGRFEVSARAAPDTLRAGEPLTLTVTVTADGPVHVPP